jgi:hypothetical protein
MLLPIGKRGKAGGALCHRNPDLITSYISPSFSPSHSAILGVVFLKSVSCELGVHGQVVLLSRKVGDVSEVVWSKMDKSDVGSSGEAGLKNVVASM